MYADRLLKLADHLEQNVEDENFSLMTWRDDAVACAIGHATEIPEFKRLGLEFRWFGHKIGLPFFEGNYSWGVSESFFGISIKDTHWLFNVSAYPHGSWTTKREVVCRIREFVRNKSECKT